MTIMIKELIKNGNYLDIKKYILANKLDDYKIIKHIIYLYYNKDDILDIFIGFNKNDDAYNIRY